MILNFFIFHFVIMVYILKSAFCNHYFDEEHRNMYPYCGRLFGYRSDERKAKSRVVNSEDSKEHELYPWVVYLKLKHLQKDLQTIAVSACMGTIIAYKHVVTAGHCVCPTWPGYKNAHEDALCRPSRTSFPINQIIKLKNNIFVYGGSNNIKNLESMFEFKVNTALVMDNIVNPKSFTWREKYDVGVLIVDGPLFNREYMKSRIGPNDKPPMLPICLAKKDYDFNGQVVHGVGWGLRYDESEKNSGPTLPKRQPYHSSCMTNEIGEEKWRFKACNMKQIEDLNWSCEKDELPLDVIKNRDRCDKYLAEAKQILLKIAKSDINFITRVHKIFVNERKASTGEIDPKKKLVCYDKDYFRIHGWCKVKGYEPMGAWGFCSPSCDNDYLAKGIDLSRDKYQDIKWKADNGQKSLCRKSKNFIPEFMTCMKPILPQADVGIFTVSDISDELELVNFQKEYGAGETEPDFRTSYISACAGDSGSGHWVTIDKDDAEIWKDFVIDGFDLEMNQRGLVTIFTDGHIVTRNSGYDYKNFPFYVPGACGSDVTLEDFTRFVEINFGTKTTNEQVLNFIKLHSEISDTTK